MLSWLAPSSPTRRIQPPWHTSTGFFWLPAGISTACKHAHPTLQIQSSRWVQTACERRLTVPPRRLQWQQLPRRCMHAGQPSHHRCQSQSQGSAAAPPCLHSCAWIRTQGCAAAAAATLVRRWLAGGWRRRPARRQGCPCCWRSSCWCCGLVCSERAASLQAFERWQLRFAAAARCCPRLGRGSNAQPSSDHFESI